MASSRAATVDAYLASLSPIQRAALVPVRQMIQQHLPVGYQEVMNWGMICYEIPFERYPTTYNGKPLSYVALAAQKAYCSLYLMGCYQDTTQAEALRAAFTAAGKQLDMGKSCVRFRRAEDLPLETIGQLIASTPPEAFIAQYEAARKRK